MSSLNAEIEKLEKTLENADEEDNYKTHRSAMIKSAASLMDEDEKKEARKAFETEDEKKEAREDSDDNEDKKVKIANTDEQMKSMDDMVKEIEKQARAHFAGINNKEPYKSLEELVDAEKPLAASEKQLALEELSGHREPEKPLAASDKQIKFEDMWN